MAANEPPQNESPRLHNDPTQIAQLIKDLMTLLLKAIKTADNDPESRSKIQLLDQSTQRTHDNPSPNAADHLKQEYANSPGLQKLVDAGLDFAEKIAKKFAPQDKQEQVRTAFGKAREYLGSLKGGPKPSAPGQNAQAAAEPEQGEASPPAASANATSAGSVPNAAGAEANAKAGADASASAEAEGGGEGPELTAPLRKILDIYKLLVKLLSGKLGEEMEGPRNDKDNSPEAQLMRKARMQHGSNFSIDQETMDQALGQMKDIYQNSPTIQKMVDTGMNFAEKIALKLAPAEYANDIKQGFDQARGICNQWKQEAAPQGPVRVKPKALQDGGVEPKSDQPAPEANAPRAKSNASRPPGPGGFFKMKI